MVAEHLRTLIDLPETPPGSDQAVAFCRAMARRHYENFTVVSWLAPRAIRPHLAVLYGYCRTVDDIGDEAPGDRLALLDRYEEQLDAAYRGTARHPVLVALQETIDRFDLPREPFARLIEANRIDQRTARYESFDELLGYCRHSADPVGRLVLGLYRACDEERAALSDKTCTALQLANFWQDVKRDAAIGRVYLPQDEMAAYGVREADLHAERGPASFVRLMQFQVERTQRYFAEGLPLLDRVSGRLRIDLALFSRGGIAILDKIEALGFDTLRERPTLSGREKVGLILSTMISRRWERWI